MQKELQFHFKGGAGTDIVLFFDNSDTTSPVFHTDGTLFPEDEEQIYEWLIVHVFPELLPILHRGVIVSMAKAGFAQITWATIVHDLTNPENIVEQ